MNSKIKMAMMFATIIAIGTVVMTTTTAATAFAKETPRGIEIADENVHERTGEEQDIRFHQGLCQAGITTEALESLGGCGILPPLGQSGRR